MMPRCGPTRWLCAAVLLALMAWAGFGDAPFSRVAADEPSLLRPDSKEAPPQGPRLREWTLIYYIAHDNDLGDTRPTDYLTEPSRRRETTLELLGQRTPSPNVAVVAFADKPQWRRLRRITITDAGRDKTTVPLRNSADADTLAACLDWVAQHMPARRYAVALMGHGRRLGEVCLDTHPYGRAPEADAPGEQGAAAASDVEKPTWMRLAEAAAVLEQWRQRVRTGGNTSVDTAWNAAWNADGIAEANADGAAVAEVELVFLQLCGAATLEAFHALRRSARFVMGSQSEVLAPNFYYAPLAEALAAQPRVDGRQVAQWIAAFDEPKMFVNYAAVESQALEQLPHQLDLALAPLLRQAGRLHPPEGEVERRIPLRLRAGEPRALRLGFDSAASRQVRTDSALALTLEVYDAAGDLVGRDVATGLGSHPSVAAFFERGRYDVRIAGTTPETAGPLELLVQRGMPLASSFAAGHDESFYDVQQWLAALYCANGLDEAPLRRLNRWLNTRLLAHHHRSSSRGSVAADWSGLSLMVPQAESALERDHGLPLPSTTQLRRLHTRLLAQ